MAPPSNSSSLAPHNGSASSSGGRSPRPHTRESRPARSGNPQRQSHRHRTPAGSSHNMNGGGVDYVDTNVNGAAYNSAFTYAMSPPYQPIPVGSDTYANQSQYYYPEEQPSSNIQYDLEIRLDEEQPQGSMTQSQQYSSYPGGNPYGQNPALGYYQSHSSAQNGVQHVPTSPTAHRWSVEYSAEERLRLGLPRYATEEEVEQARRAYEETTHQLDYSRSVPQSGRQ